jgi:pimeloyl-ACP methyl ester carboxylesterase
MEKQIVYQGRQVNYKVEGSGPTLVLLHGFLENLHIWDDFSNALSKLNKVISVDLPGFGKTEVFSDNHPMEFMADVVHAVLQEEKVNQCLLAGHSMGGYVSLAFAEKYSGLLKGLILFHSHASADSDEVKANRSRTIEVVKQDHQRFIINFIPLLFAEENVEQYAEKIDALKEMSLKTTKEGVIAALAGMRDRKDQKELLTKVAFPVLFIVGKKDSRISMETIQPQLFLPKHSEALILENVGHMGFIEARKETLRTLSHFGVKWF